MSKETKQITKQQNNHQHECFNLETKHHFLNEFNKERREKNEILLTEHSKFRSLESKFGEKKKIIRTKHECFDLGMKFTYKNSEKDSKTKGKEGSIYKNLNNYRHIFENTGVRDENVSWLMKLRENDHVNTSLNMNNDKVKSSIKVDDEGKSTTKPQQEFNFHYKSRKDEKMNRLFRNFNIVKDPYMEMYNNQSTNELLYSQYTNDKSSLDFKSNLRVYSSKDHIDNAFHSGFNKEEERNKTNKNNIWIKYPGKFIDSQENLNLKDPSHILPYFDSVFTSSIQNQSFSMMNGYRLKNNSMLVNDFPNFSPPKLSSLKKNYEYLENKGLNSHTIKYSFQDVNYNGQKIKKKTIHKQPETSSLIGSTEVNHRANKAEVQEMNSANRYNIDYKDRNLNNLRHYFSSSSSALCSQFQSSLRLKQQEKVHDSRRFFTSSHLNASPSKHASDLPFGFMNFNQIKERIRKIRADQKGFTIEKNRFALQMKGNGQ